MPVIDLFTGEVLPDRPLKAKREKERDWIYIDGMLFKEHTDKISKGTCGPGGSLEYEYWEGKEGLKKVVSLLHRISNDSLLFGYDFETGPKQRAIVDPETGEFDMSTLSYAVGNNHKTTGSDPHTSTVFLLSLSIEYNKAIVVDVREMLALQIKDEFTKALGRACTEGKPIAHNMAFDWLFIKKLCGVNAICYFDTMIATRLLYAGLPSDTDEWTDPNHDAPRLKASLGDVAYRELGMKLDKESQAFFLKLHPETALTNELIAYAAADTAILLQLTEYLEHKLFKDRTSYIWEEIERPFLPIIAETMYEGVNFDHKAAIALRKKAVDIIKGYQDKWDVKHPNIDITSFPQLLVLFKKKYPKENILNVDEKTLAKIAYGVDEDDVLDEDADIILRFRKANKVEGTYLYSWIYTHRNPITGRIHPTFNQCDTHTGRMSATSPAAQTIPSRGEWAIPMRSLFVASEGNLLCDQDLSQFEARALADMANEPKQIQIFVDYDGFISQIEEYKEQNPGATDDDPIIISLQKKAEESDYHCMTAANIYEKAFTEADAATKKDMRGDCKSINFGIPYGIGPAKLSRQIKKAQSAAQELIDKYKRTYPRVAEFLEYCQVFGRTHLYITNPIGRKRRYKIPSDFRAKTVILKDGENTKMLNAYNYWLGKAERQSTNHPIQSINGDVLKKAAIIAYPYLKERNWRYVFFVHDEILGEGPSQYAKEVQKELDRALKEAARFCGLNKVTIGTSGSIASFWSH